MEGQWSGSPTENIHFSILLNIDENEDNYSGTVHLYNQNPAEPDIIARFQTRDKSRKQNLQLHFEAVDPITFVIIPTNQLPKTFPKFEVPTPINVSFVAQQKSLKVNWTQSDGSPQSRTLQKSKATHPSTYTGGNRFRSWSSFRNFAMKLEPNRYIFRGQSFPYRLRTGFHRTKRKDLLRLLNEDIPHLLRLVNAQTSHYFDLNDKLRAGAFWNLIQHYGYPTPLLDWTHSPFVAAYFAYRKQLDPLNAKQKIRIFMFNRREWETDFLQINSIAITRPHLSTIETIALENDRAIAQQALFTISSVDDIESHIKDSEKLKSKSYLQVFDLPFDDRETVMRELSLMGITAGSMFPGIDGACEELRERFF